jgi:Asp-tRNA(Asn)/Glu-tRNA(Gln) amidotransferase A subunit family amidase
MNVMATSEGGDTFERAAADSWNCLSHILLERARAQLAGLAHAQAVGERSSRPLFGVPYVAKSLFNVKDVPTLAGGPDLDRVPCATADAELICQLTAAGAVLVGVAHMDEYAYGFLGHNAHHGRVINPRYPELYSGGSSSGSAAAVAAGIVPFAIGSDTNGSVRVPAAFCNVFSLKPTFGRLSLQGSFSLAPSLDHAGILANSIDTIERVWHALTPEGRCQSAHEIVFGFAGGDYTALSSTMVLEGMRMLHAHWPEAPILAFDHVEESFAAASVITAYEAASIHMPRLRKFPELYSASIAERLLAAAEVSFAEYQIAIASQKALTFDLHRRFEATGIDVLVLPVTPVMGLSVDENYVPVSGIRTNAADAAGLFTRPFSLSGFPALTIPAHRPAQALTCSNDVVGPLQLVAKPGQEDQLVELARILETRLSC